MEKIQLFRAEDLQSICKILADTSKGLTGSEIEYWLKNGNIPDVSPGATKWKRLYDAFVEFQNKHQFGNHVVKFIIHVMNPVLYTDKPFVFAERRDKLNAVLSFSGMSVGDDGKIRRVEKASNLDEAMARASRLHAALLSRQVHPDILLFCKAELFQENYFHAIFEAMKSITEKIRRLSGASSDGATLVDDAFGFKGGGDPILAINALATESQRGEQRGFVNLLKGLYGTIRNPIAHDPKIEWDTSEQDVMDILTTLSLIHRKLDNAEKFR